MRQIDQAMSDSYPLGPPIRPEPKPVDLDEYKPIPDRPGWLINGNGQMAREGQVVQPIWPWPNWKP